MGRIGRAPIQILDGVKVQISGNKTTVSGPKGQLELDVPQKFVVKISEKEIVLSCKGSEDSALQGLFRMHIFNMVKGVKDGFEKSLELMGVGYRASLQGKKLALSVGYSHPVEVDPPQGITFQLEGQNKIKILGLDKQLVGQVAADIRAVRKVEPYKGKGIKYSDEKVRRKAGKAAKTATAAGA